VYAAGVLYGLTHGLTWKQSGHLGSHAAARIVSQMGPRLERKFTPDEVRRMIGE
jgi:sugar/nucleoside kinase (ribokinase family)